MVKVFSRKQTPGNKLRKERLVQIITGLSPLAHRFGFVCSIGTTRIVGGRYGFTSRNKLPAVANIPYNPFSLRPPHPTLTVFIDIHLM